MILRLSRITLREIRMTLREPFEISSGRTTGRRILLLELEDVDGTTTWSECVAGERPNFSAETI
ncbi:MAG: o-succinylbenzoate synthase, partial [Acidobacteria bacterium]|nr:o-succinylbenzoate synthase [Acidobacteriota bacterium]